MGDLMDFIFSIPWFVWFVIFWIYCVHVWRTFQTMTPEERIELAEKKRRKTLGLD